MKKDCMNGRVVTGLAATLACAATVGPSFAQISVEIGVHDLAKRLGALTPTGAGVVVGQVEAPDGANWGPNQLDPEFAGKTFLLGPNPPAGPGSSGHATLVGQNMYGLSSGMAPGITTIYLYEASSWFQNSYLRFNQGGANPPLVPPGGLKIFNNSWVGSVAGGDNDVLRRADFAVNRDQTIIVNGVNNSGAQQPLMCHQFNCISVGLANGTHVAGPTLPAYDGPGRMKPEIVAPSQFTSFAAPYVDAVAARIVQAARTAPLSSNPSAERADVIKAALMAGANHRAGWTNCTGPCTSGSTRGITAAPLDAVYGADVVNANNAHLILTGLEQSGNASPTAATPIKRRGWDLSAIGPNSTLYYRFHISAVADKVSILGTWNRDVMSNFTGGTLANFNITLRRINPNGSFQNLTGNAGLPYFSAGNVISNSSVDNVEHLFVHNLQPGDYLIEIERIDSMTGTRNIALAWLMPKKDGDVNEDGVTNVADLLAVIGAWGACLPPCLPACAADLNGDCSVNVTDLLEVISNWG